jgi:hypothetical protein
MIVVGWILALGVSLSIVFGVRKGLGRNDADISPRRRDDLRKSEYTFPCFMCVTYTIMISWSWEGWERVEGTGRRDKESRD